ncbi:MAG: ABC transporter ATP-binding protein [Treponema sp.]|nr:ABC transporter ATP-binding protein [Treponema sp.]
MQFLQFNDVSFTYPPVEGDIDADGKQIVPRPVFEHFSAELPQGFVSFVGQNGCGKSTLLLLASGRLMPQTGSVTLLGQNPALLEQEPKNLLASVIYQNMEFESQDKVSELLAQVYAGGTLKAKASGIRDSNADLLSECIDVFELEGVLNHTLTGISKGEMQRVLLAFALLYGSASIFMDEPLFAMEEPQKERALAYLRDFVHKTGTSIYLSMHELDLTRRYADTVLLFYPNRDMDMGTPEEVLTKDALEKAYGVPHVLLKDGEEYTRKHLQDVSEAIKDLNERKAGD